MSKNKVEIRIENVSEKEFLKLIKNRIKSANKKGKCVSVSSDTSNVEEIYIEGQDEVYKRTGYEEIIIRIEV